MLVPRSSATGQPDHTRVTALIRLHHLRRRAPDDEVFFPREETEAGLAPAPMSTNGSTIGQTAAPSTSTCGEVTVR